MTTWQGMQSSRAALGLISAVVFAACDIGSTTPDVRVLTITPPAGLAVGVGGTMRFHLEALGDDGTALPIAGATWEVDDPTIATVSSAGAASGVAAGVTRVTARLGGASATASLEVWVPDPVESYEAGISYFGRNGYVEYVPGELPVILSAPHGGRRTPSEIADRADGVSVTDANTLELTLAVRDALFDLTGRAPYVVLSHLDRSKLDPNREIVEGAQDDPFAEQAWEEYHGFIERARERVAAMGGGMYFDMHGHGHPKDRLELGYLLGADRLDRPDATLDNLATVQLTSIREIGRTSPIPFSQLLRGPTSFGGLLEAEGVPAVPSPSIPSPGSDPYFSGGYSTLRHGSIRDTEFVSAIQIEHHFAGLRDSDVSRRAYSARVAAVIRAFMLEHFGYFEQTP